MTLQCGSGLGLLDMGGKRGAALLLASKAAGEQTMRQCVKAAIPKRSHAHLPYPNIHISLLLPFDNKSLQLLLIAGSESLAPVA